MKVCASFVPINLTKRLWHSIKLKEIMDKTINIKLMVLFLPKMEICACDTTTAGVSAKVFYIIGGKDIWKE